MTRLVLVSCVKRKLQRPAAAKDLYMSQWFRKARSYAESKGDLWRILSARHGVLDPNQVVEPYDESLMTANMTTVRRWGNKVIGQLTAWSLSHHRSFDSIEVLAGERYRKVLMSGLRTFTSDVTVPMKGLGIGQQLKWLKENS